jgi:histidyl-tRNA synthetase
MRDNSRVTKKVKETIQEMDTLFGYLEAFDCLDNISFDFSLARGLDYYTGLIYEAVLTDTNRVGSIAGGGRYDGLVGMFSGKQIPAVGVSVGIERVFAILEEKSKDDYTVRPTETQILIA